MSLPRSRITRRQFVARAAAVLAAPYAASHAVAGPSAGFFFAYVGTYTPNGGGIYLFRIDRASAAFVQVQRTVTSPLLPLRVILDRNRAGAYLAVGLTFVSAFGLFLFLTYYLQSIQGYSPVKTGLAFLPLPVDLVLASTISNVVLLPRFGSRRLVVTGLLTACVGMALLTRLTPDSSYATHVLPGNAPAIVRIWSTRTGRPHMSVASSLLIHQRQPDVAAIRTHRVGRDIQSGIIQRQ